MASNDKYQELLKALEEGNRSEVARLNQAILGGREDETANNIARLLNVAVDVFGDNKDTERGGVCSTCGNSGKIECPSCDDGFIRDDGGYMFACGGCDGEGFIDCPDCD